MEIDLSFQDVHQYNTGTGLTNFDFGGRLSYELAREFAYMWGSWEKLVFKTVNLAEAKGDKASHFAFFIGIRLAL